MSLFGELYGNLDMWFYQVMYVTLICDISTVTIEITSKEDYFVAN